MRRFSSVVMILLFSLPDGFAQCAMCRSTLENNISNGDVGIAAGINTGILYLLSLPYLAVLILAYLWYKNSRKEAVRLPHGTTAG